MQIAACWNVLWTTLRNSSLSSSRSFHWKDLKNLKPWILWLFVTVTHLMLAAPWSCEATLPRRSSGPGCREAVEGRRSSGSRVDPLVIRCWSAASKKFPRISSLPQFGSRFSMFWHSLFWFVDIVLVGSRGCSIATSFSHSLPSLVHGSQCKHYQNHQRKMFGAGPFSKGCGSEVFWGADLSGSAVRQWREKCRRAVPVCIKRLGIFERSG